ncbi:hypothetical protein [Frankia sp. Cas3]|uniref:DUF7065 domain-containing protein n=1 Tax=Frankia sp. Cas3 TaxID=3073926 RepID=UPI002AD41295|nr:hypothetical protein [Frankia sp. Cas3]
MGARLELADAYLHTPGSDPTWSESRYVDFYDATARVGGWLRLGMRPNEGHAEVSACVYLPDGRVAFAFTRAPIGANGLAAGGQEWSVGEPYVAGRVRVAGEALLLDDPWLLTDPRRAYAQCPRIECELDLVTSTQGLAAVMGSDQEHIEKIFLPGQADFHYQHLAHITGTVRVGDMVWQLDGRGGKDHSWGPRNWQAKIYMRWLICSLDDDTGFMLLRAVGPTRSTRSGHVWVGGEFAVVDDFEMHNAYAGEPHHELRSVSVRIFAADREWSASGQPVAWLPARHRRTGADGVESILRIVKSPTMWTWPDGRVGVGHCEYHDLLQAGVPVGLAD